MSVASLRRWQWIAISLAVGLAIGYVRQQSADDLQERFGESINGQQHFEQMLTSTVEGQPAFQQITVHAQSVPDGKGGTTRVHIVAGSAFNGHAEDIGGKSIAKLYPSFFMASVPYRPKINLSTLNRPGGPDLARQFQSIAQPTVLDFLNVVSQLRGISYTHAWWLEMGLLQWTIASFLVVGILWPTVVNLLVFGSWRRPVEEKGIDLSKVSAASAPSMKPQLTPEDEARLKELETELEQNLSTADTPATATVSQAPAPIRSPTGGALAQVASTSADQVEFGTKKDDYYPTEVHAGKVSKGS